MAGDIGFDLSLLGDKALVRRMKRLEKKTQRKIISRALRKSAYRTRERVVSTFQMMTNEQTGQTATALKKSKVRAQAGGRFAVRIGLLWPTRDELGIDPEDPYYYPFAIEYGHVRAPARPFVRSAVDANAGQELGRLTADMASAIEDAF